LGITCTKDVHISVSSSNITIILGDSPRLEMDGLNVVALDNGRTTFTGGEIVVNDMFQYVKLQTGVEIIDKGTINVIMCHLVYAGTC